MAELLQFCNLEHKSFTQREMINLNPSIVLCGDSFTDKIISSELLVCTFLDKWLDLSAIFKQSL